MTRVVFKEIISEKEIIEVDLEPGFRVTSSYKMKIEEKHVFHIYGQVSKWDRLRDLYAHDIENIPYQIEHVIKNIERLPRRFYNNKIKYPITVFKDKIRDLKDEAWRKIEYGQ